LLSFIFPNYKCVIIFPRDLFLKFENVLSDLTKPFLIHISYQKVTSSSPIADSYSDVPSRICTGSLLGRCPPPPPKKNHTHIPAGVLGPLGSFDFSSI